jgi:SAM-dependent methyltransferase
MNADATAQQSGTPHAHELAYGTLAPDFTHRVERLKSLLRDFVDTAQRHQGPLLHAYKPWIALALHWKFDYLAKLRSSPFELANDLQYWLGVMDMIGDLGRQAWHILGAPTVGRDSAKDVANPFNVMWPLTTAQDDDFESFVRMARQRLEQLLALMGGHDALRGKHILDVGCGPGRYIQPLLDLGVARVTGIDVGDHIIAATQARFGGDPRVEIAHGSCHDLSAFPDSAFDFVLSNGVLHHTDDASIPDMIREHARVVAPRGHFFLYIAGDGGLELELWEHLRLLLADVPIYETYRALAGHVTPIRLQGLLDHCYAPYRRTSRTDCEAWLGQHFLETVRVPGVAGLDVTPELYADDPFFQARFGSGNLRYLCRK